MAQPLRKKAAKAHAGESAGRFPIVGIGASAGGLIALEEFLGHVPAASGMAYVVIQHLDPKHEGMLPELLQRSTGMPVVEAKHRQQVKRDCVYVIPPNKSMTLHGGKLALSPFPVARGPHMPIDSFLVSLAEQSQHLAVGVVLSGMGSDGTLGCRAIKANDGVVLAQDPASTQFDSMPRSVISDKLADGVASADELPGKILSILQHAPTSDHDDAELGGDAPNSMAKVIGLLYKHTHHDFSTYKKNTLQRRIARRISIHQLESAEEYVQLLLKNPQELDLLFKEMCIGVTRFFRDPAAWDYLRDKVIPAILAEHPKGYSLRAWVAGCSSGEEAYSLAISFKQAVAQVGLPGQFSLQIFATDIDADAIESARAGLYPGSIAADVDRKRLGQFFNHEGGHYHIRSEIREMVTFALQDVIHDPPFTKLDILTCRNLLIYLTSETQKTVLPLFHYSLNPGGTLFLGSAETANEFPQLFSPMTARLSLYRKLPSLRTEHPAVFSMPHWQKSAAAERVVRKPAVNLQSQVEQLLLDRFCPAAVLVNGDGDIVYINGRTGEYLEPAAGKTNWNVYAMVRAEWRDDLTSALHKALRDRSDVTIRDLKFGKPKAGHALSISIHVLKQPEELSDMALITFTKTESLEVDKRGARRGLRHTRVADMEAALKRAHEDNHLVRANFQNAQEELKSVNEELQSTNEELQSNVEELTTSKEEIQSMNEELQTVNAELQAKVNDLINASSDIKNLLDSTDIITVFLDGKLRVRRFTRHATQIFKLIPGDVGRPLSDVVTDLVYKDLQSDAREVLNTLVLSDKQVETRDDRWFRVRIMPYRTINNLIDGVVITFTDITQAKVLESKLRRQAQSS